MEIIISPVNFCYKSILKDEFRRGRIKLKRDITRMAKEFKKGDLTYGMWR